MSTYAAVGPLAFTLNGRLPSGYAVRCAQRALGQVIFSQKGNKFGLQKSAADPADNPGLLGTLNNWSKAYHEWGKEHPWLQLIIDSMPYAGAVSLGNAAFRDAMEGRWGSAAFNAAMAMANMGGLPTGLIGKGLGGIGKGLGGKAPGFISNAWSRLRGLGSNIGPYLAKYRAWNALKTLGSWIGSAIKAPFSFINYLENKVPEGFREQVPGWLRDFYHNLKGNLLWVGGMEGLNYLLQPNKEIQKPLPGGTGIPNTGPSPYPENRIIYPENRLPSSLPNLPPGPPVRVAPVPTIELPFEKNRESIEPGRHKTPGGGIRFDVKAPNERNQGTDLAQAPNDVNVPNERNQGTDLAQAPNDAWMANQPQPNEGFRRPLPSTTQGPENGTAPPHVPNVPPAHVATIPGPQLPSQQHEGPSGPAGPITPGGDTHYETRTPTLVANKPTKPIGYGELKPVFGKRGAEDNVPESSTQNDIPLSIELGDYRSPGGGTYRTPTSTYPTYLDPYFWRDTPGNFERLDPYFWYDDTPGNIAHLDPDFWHKAPKERNQGMAFVAQAPTNIGTANQPQPNREFQKPLPNQPQPNREFQKPLPNPTPELGNGVTLSRSEAIPAVLVAPNAPGFPTWLSEMNSRLFPTWLSEINWSSRSPDIPLTRPFPNAPGHPSLPERTDFMEDGVPKPKEKNQAIPLVQTFTNIGLNNQGAKPPMSQPMGLKSNTRKIPGGLKFGTIMGKHATQDNVPEPPTQNDTQPPVPDDSEIRNPLELFLPPRLLPWMKAQSLPRIDKDFVTTSGEEVGPTGNVVQTNATPTLPGNVAPQFQPISLAYHNPGG